MLYVTENQQHTDTITKMEKTPLIAADVHALPSGPQEFKLYTRRWFMLIMFSCVSMMQCVYWITYGSLADSTKEYYHVSGSTINLLAAFGPIAFIPLSLHSSWAIAALGLRKTVFVGALACTLGAVIRSFAWSRSSFWLVYVGQFLNAAAGPVVMTVPPALSAMWFGVDERTFATGVGTTANSAGGPIAFCIGLFVTTKESYFYTLYAEAIFGIVVLLCIFFFFDDRPPTPPCLTSKVKTKQQVHHAHIAVHNNEYGSIGVQPYADGAAVVSMVNEKEEEEVMSVTEYCREAWKVIKNVDCMNIVLTLGTTAGSASGWAAMLVIIITELGHSQHDAQVIGLANGAIGILAGICVGKLHDRFRHYKVIMVSMFVLLSASMVYFSLATQNGKYSVLPSSFVCILIATSLAGFAMSAANPLGYEALAELSYPISETVGAILLNNLNNLLCLVFLLIGDHLTAPAANWLYTGTAVAGVLTLACLRERYPRSSIDLAATVAINK